MNIQTQSSLAFRVGGPIKAPKNFIGRQDILSKIFSALQAQKLQNISIHGERRTGKTSLLLYLAHPTTTSQYLPENHIPVYFDFQSYTNVEPLNIWRDLANTISGEIRHRATTGEKDASQFLSVMQELFSSSDLSLPFATIFTKGLGELRRAGYRLHLLFDEFEQTAQNPKLGDSFYDTLRSLPTRASNISYVIATRTGLSVLQPTYNKVSSPFFNIFSTILLRPFSEDEVFDLIFQYFEQAKIDLSYAENLCSESNFLYETTGYHPFLLQALCYHLCANLGDPAWPNGHIRDAALEAFTRDTKPHFHFYWQISSEREQNLLRNITTEEYTDPGQLQSLKERCLIVPKRNATGEKWQLVSSIFAQWIEQHVAYEEVEPTHETTDLIFSEDGSPIKSQAEDSSPLQEFDTGFFSVLETSASGIQLHNDLYITRSSVDSRFMDEISRKGSIITIYATQQTGKTSLLARGMFHAYQRGYQTVYIDVKQINRSSLESYDFFLRHLGEVISRKLTLSISKMEQLWRDLQIGPQDKLNAYMEEHVLPRVDRQLVLALDDTDSLLDLDNQNPYYKDFFALLRSWYNWAAYNPLWEKLNIIVVIKNEPYLLIPNLRQSPFNVGMKLRLKDFTKAETLDLINRYNALPPINDIEQFFTLLNGHPYLSRKAIYTLKSEQLNWENFLKLSGNEDGPFASQLRYLKKRLSKDLDLQAAVWQILRSNRSNDENACSRLLLAGIIQRTETENEYIFRCNLYRDYVHKLLNRSGNVQA